MKRASVCHQVFTPFTPFSFFSFCELCLVHFKLSIFLLGLLSLRCTKCVQIVSQEFRSSLCTSILTICLLLSFSISCCASLSPSLLPSSFHGLCTYHSLSLCLPPCFPLLLVMFVLRMKLGELV